MNRRRFLASLFGGAVTAAAVAVSPAPMAVLVSGEGLGMPPMIGLHGELMRLMSEEVSREIDREIIKGLMREARS